MSRLDLSDFESGAPYEGDYDKDLARLQKRISRLFVSNLVHQKRAIILCEGWDAAGKGGAIQRLTAQCDPRSYQVWPIAAPSEEERAHHYLWRFWQRLPRSGEVAIFDRSWYGRVLVERVEGFASDADWRRAYDEIDQFEAALRSDGTLIVKLFFHATSRVQAERLRARIEHPWKRWKVTAEDLRNRARRPEYLEAIGEMFERTDTPAAPWRIVDGNDKKAARIAALGIVAEALAAELPEGPPEASPELGQIEQLLASETG